MSFDYPIQQIPFHVAMYHFAIHRGDIHHTIQSICDTFQGVNFKVSIPIPLIGKTIWVLQDNHHVKDVLKSHHTLLGAANENFNISQGHVRSINGLHLDDPLWKPVHDALHHVFSHNKISAIMKNESYLAALRPSEVFCINEALENYLYRVWGEYSFGGNITPAVYKQLHDDINVYVKSAFHANTLNRLPWIGKALSYYYYVKHRDMIGSIDARLNGILDAAIDSKEGAFASLFGLLRNDERLSAISDSEIRTIVLDNAFLSFLVYDFMYALALDFMVSVAKDQPMDRHKVLEESKARSFLFPFRFRIVQENIGEILPGDLCILNLKKAKQFFSYGPRSCPGSGLYHDFMKQLIDYFSSYSITLNNPGEEVVYSPNPDVPLILSRHDIVIQPRV